MIATSGLGKGLLDKMAWHGLELQMKEFDYIFAAKTLEALNIQRIRLMCWKYAIKAERN